MSDIIVRGRKLKVDPNKKPAMVVDFPNDDSKKPKATKKKKPTIKHISFQCDFNSAMDFETLNPAPAKMEIHSMDISFGVKLENVPMDGAIKYEIMDEIKKAVEKVKEKYS